MDSSGDEMNCHLAQSIQARNELERIANVKYQIISAKDSNPIIGVFESMRFDLHRLKHGSSD